MLRTFSDCCHFAFQESGNLGIIRLWIPTLADLCLTVVDKHLDQGLLSSGVLIVRAVSVVILTVAAVMFAVSRGEIFGTMLAAIGLLILGAFGLFITSQQGQAMISRKINMTDRAYDFHSELEVQRRNARKWTVIGNLGRGFLFQWVAASGLGLVAGFAMFGFLIRTFDTQSDIGIQTVVSLTGGVVLGASIGISQWLILRNYVARPDYWISASTLGVTTGFMVGLILYNSTGGLGGYYGSIVIGALVVGAALGLAEWLILRRYVARAGWWVFANSIGLLMAVGLSGFLAQVLYFASANVLGEGFATFLSALVAGGLLLVSYGSITGSVLVWLLRQPAQEMKSLQSSN
jgi:hypothetical protein